MREHPLETLRREGRQALSEIGIGADTDERTCREHAGRSAEIDAALVEILQDRETVEAAEALREIAAKSRDKAVRREAKRALYRLQQKGIRAPEPEAVAARPLLETTIEGYLTPVDGAGDQLIFLVRPRPGGILQLYGVINDPGGLRDVELLPVTRKIFREANRKLFEKHGISVLEADGRYCDFRLSQAFTWSRESNAPMHGDYPALRAELVSVEPPQEMAPLVFSLVDAEEVRGEPSLVADSASLLREPEMRTWILDHRTLQPYIERLREAESSPVVLNEAQRAERAAQIVDDIVREVFGADMRESWVRRLLENAYCLAKTGRMLPAQRAVAAALALEDSDSEGTNVPLFRELASASMAIWLEAWAREEKERGEDSLIISPHQFREEQKRRR